MKIKFFDKKIPETQNKTGWRPLPMSLKVFFVVMVILVAFSFFSLNRGSYFILGFIIRGMAAKIILVLLNTLAPTILLIAMLKKASWTSKYAMLYLGFFILNSLIGIISYTWLIPEGLLKYVWSSILIGAVMNLILIFFFLLFWRNKNYFEK